MKVSLRELISLYISLVFIFEGMAYFSSLIGCFFVGAKRDGGQHGYDSIGSKCYNHGHGNPANQAYAC